MFELTRGLVFAPLADGFLLVLVDIAVKACVIFLLASATAIVLSRWSAATRHLVWAAAFLAFLLLPILACTVPKWSVLPVWQGAWNVDSRTEAPHQSSPAIVDSRSPGGRSPTTESTPATAERASTTSVAKHSPKPTSTPRWHGSWTMASRAAFVAWLTGVGLLIARTWCGRLILRHVLHGSDPVRGGPLDDEIRSVRRQLGIMRPVHVYLSERRATPMTWGLLRRELLLPAEARSWDQRRLRSVLLHELGHLKHGDSMMHIVTQLIGAIYWFHPLVWIALRRLQIERELACDDLVLRSGVRSSDYAEDLLSILVQRPIPANALAIIGQSPLEGRLCAILKENVDRRSITTKGLILALVISVTGTAALAALQTSKPFAAESPAPSAKPEAAALPPSPPAPKVSIVCVDREGHPVPGAEVSLFQHSGGGKKGHYLLSGTGKSDADGKAAFANPLFSDENGNFDRWIYARVPGRLVGVGRIAKWTNQKPINPEGRVLMVPSRSIEGEVHVPAGFDPTKVLVSVRVLRVSTGPGALDWKSFPRELHFPGLDTALPEIFDRRPDSNGRIRFEDVPVSGWVCLVTSGAGLAEAQWRNDSAPIDRRIQMTLEQQCLVTGHVVTPTGQPAVGVDVIARLSPRRQQRIFYLSSFKSVTDANGKFAIQGLPPTEFVLSVQDPAKRLILRPLENLVAHPGQDLEMTLGLEVGTLVSGRVLDAEGKPVEAAGFSAISGSEIGSQLDNGSTDAHGKYQFRLPAGGARLYFNALPTGFAYPDPQVVKELDIKPGQADIQNLDFTIRRQ